jgi:protein SCO1/2
MTRAGVLVIALTLLLAAAGWRLANPSEAPLPVLDTLGGDFRLPSTLAESSTLAQFNDQVVLLNFGFTSCPQICPVTLARMREVVGSFADQDAAVRPLFVTLDPKRDSVERMRTYLKPFGKTFVGFTGTPDQISEVARLYKVYVAYEDTDGLVHSSQIYLIDRNGRVRATFGQSATVAAMTETVGRLLRETS